VSIKKGQEYVACRPGSMSTPDRIRIHEDPLPGLRLVVCTAAVHAGGRLYYVPATLLHASQWTKGKNGRRRVAGYYLVQEADLLTADQGTER
jgi:hypothetical protein